MQEWLIGGMAATILLAAGFCTPAVASTVSLEAACRAVTGSANCVTPKPFQPSTGQMETASIVYDSGDPGFDFSLYGNNQKTIVVDGLPYASYWQLKDRNKYVFHPMVWGRFVFNNADDPAFRERLPALSQRIGVEVPNGGLAFFYPDNFPLARMIGPEVMFSAISQSEALAGYAKAAQFDPRLSDLAERVKTAMLLDHRYGGTNLNGEALLEFPLFHSNPEVILNGWLHALLKLSDYAVTTHDTASSELIRRNLEFFVRNHGAWYDDKRNISRYSDTSPVRIELTGTDGAPAFRVVYKARDAALPDYAIPPVEDTSRTYGGFDDRILKSNAGSSTTLASVNCSSLYDTFIVSDRAFSVKVREGGYNPRRATPEPDGPYHTIQSSAKGGLQVAQLALDNGELICGYPTNFSKENGKNYYHMQHIVALLYLAKFPAFDDPRLTGDLEKIAREWLERTSQFDQGPGLEFESPQKVLDGINRGKLLNQEKTFEELLK
ncbi:MAG: hypothetical protein M9924_13965 [Rhizobiaceae bacterium]|nr:hypothetical protein [Rhizobiaceae bacterium]